MHASVRHIPHLLFLAAALALAGCGGGTQAAAAVDPPGAPPPELPPGAPPPADDTLDQQLAPLLANANVAPIEPPPAAPADLVELGRALFFDKILSGNRDIACATCHHPLAATGDALSVSIGSGGVGLAADRRLGSGALIPRNAPHVFNVGLPGLRLMFWDGRVSRGRGPAGPLQTPEPALNGPAPAAPQIAAQLTSALAAQAMFPVTSEAEMRGQAGENEIADANGNLEVWSRLMARLVGTDDGREGGIAAYRGLFRAAFPQVTNLDELNFGHAARALAAYQATAFGALNTPFDAYLAGDRTAISDEAKRGALLFFGRANCARCHRGSLLTDQRFHAIAVPQVGPGKDFPFEDTGRALVTGDPEDVYRFRTPSLRNVELTGPWMHDGAFTSLRAVVEHYDDPVGDLLTYDATQLAALMRPTVDTSVARNQARADALDDILRPPPRLLREDVESILAFLRSLTDPASRDLSAEVPPAVPSGLPVAD